MPESKEGEGAGGRPTELQRQMDRIGDRFVQRLLAELTMMRELIVDLRAGEFAALQDLELFAHRIHGSSAMFGLAAISELAGELENLLSRVEPAALPEADLLRIEQQFGRLEAAGRAATHARFGS